MEIVCAVLRIYFFVILATVIMSWIPTSEGSAPDRIKLGLRTVTEPVFAPVRKALPPVRMGATALDLSPLIVFFGLQLVIAFLCV